MLSSIIETYERLVLFLKVLLGLELKQDEEQLGGCKSIENLEMRICEHLRSTMSALQTIVETASRLDKIAGKHTETLDLHLLDEVNGLNNELQTILIPSNPSSSALDFQKELKAQVVSIASSIILQELMKRIEQQQIKTKSSIRHFIRRQISSLGNNDLPIQERELIRLLDHTPVNPMDLTKLILKSNPDIKLPIPMLSAMVPQMATFLVRKIKLASDLRGGSVDEAAIRSIMNYDRWLQAGIVQYRDKYGILEVRLKQQGLKQAVARSGEGARSRPGEGSGQLLSKGMEPGADSGPAAGQGPLGPAKSISNGGTDRITAKPSDIFVFVSRKREGLVEDSIRIISQLSGGMRFSPNTMKSMKKEFNKTIELLLRLMTKKILLDAPLNAAMVLDLLNQNIEKDPKFDQTLAPLYAKIIGSVIVTKSAEAWK